MFFLLPILVGFGCALKWAPAGTPFIKVVMRSTFITIFGGAALSGVLLFLYELATKDTIDEGSHALVIGLVSLPFALPIILPSIAVGSAFGS